MVCRRKKNIQKEKKTLLQGLVRLQHRREFSTQGLQQGGILARHQLFFDPHSREQPEYNFSKDSQTSACFFANIPIALQALLQKQETKTIRITWDQMSKDMNSFEDLASSFRCMLALVSYQVNNFIFRHNLALLISLKTSCWDHKFSLLRSVFIWRLEMFHLDILWVFLPTIKKTFRLARRGSVVLLGSGQRNLNPSDFNPTTPT